MHFQMAYKLKKAGVKIETKKKFIKMKMNSATCKGLESQQTLGLRQRDLKVKACLGLLVRLKIKRKKKV